MNDPKKKVLIIDDQADQLNIICSIFREGGEPFNILRTQYPRKAYDIAVAENPDVIISDWEMPDLSGIELTRKFRSNSRMRDTPIVLCTAVMLDPKHFDIAIHAGATDYIRKPIEPVEMRARVRSMLKLADSFNIIKQQNEEYKKLFEALREQKKIASATKQYIIDKGSGYFSGLVYKSPAMAKIMELTERYANVDKGIFLITGETGTGKELIARHIHKNSLRRNEAFIVVNCAAMKHEIAESDLFGHEKGAFTGASSSRIGHFEAAHKGILFLDEVGELDLKIQAKLLRVLEQGEFQRVGSSKMTHVDVQVIVATNRNLKEEVRAGNFREDLYYRLCLFPIHLPTLKDRKMDIEPLTHFFIQQLEKKFKRKLDVSQEVIRHLSQYSWPGNIRELKNVIERGFVLSHGTNLDIQPIFEMESTGPDENSYLVSYEDLLKNYFRQLLTFTKGNKTKAAQIARLHKNTFFSKLKAVGYEESDDS